MRKSILGTVLALGLVCMTSVSVIAADMDVTDGKATGEVTVKGIVAPITTINVDVPLTIDFTIDADRNITFPEDIKIVSHCPAVLNVVSSSVVSVVDTNAPDLVAQDKYTDEEWNNLGIADTKKNLALICNDQDLSTADVTLGSLESAFGTVKQGEGDGAIDVPKTTELPLVFKAKYGKSWNNTTDTTFSYTMTLGISIA